MRQRNMIKISKKTLSKGLSLIELLIAVGILAFAICAALYVYAQCSVLITTSKNINSATNGALALTEEIRSTPFLCLSKLSCCSGAFCHRCCYRRYAVHEIA